MSHTKLFSFFILFLIAALAGGVLAEPAAEPTPLPDVFSVDNLTAESAVLIDADTGDVLYSRNSRVRMFPASTTKIMTLLLGLESDIRLDDWVTIPAEAGSVGEGSSVVPVYPGDQMTWRDLLYGFMLNSGNDGANAIAVLAGGSINAFVAQMNERAAAMGCEGTHFANPHGYQDNDHYTTAMDLAIMAREAMKNDDFRAIVAAPWWEMTITRKGETVTQGIESRVSLLVGGQKYYYQYCTGIKTGHTRKAGWCFVGSASRDGVNLICVALNCPEETDKWFDAARLWEYGFAQYEQRGLGELLRMAAPGFVPTVQVENAAADDPMGGSLSVSLSDIDDGGAAIPVNTQLEGALDGAVAKAADGARIAWSRPLEAPIAQGEALGTVTWQTDVGTVSAKLIADRDVPAEPEPQPVALVDGSFVRPWMIAAGGAVVALAILMIALGAIEREREKKRRRKKKKAAARRAAKK